MFCRRNKHCPIELLRWFLLRCRLHLGVAINVLRVDNGGELWGNATLRIEMGAIYVHLECTEGYASSANGLSENSIRMVSRVDQCLLFGGGRDVTFWCFALLHACLLVGIRTRSENITSHECLFGVRPSIDRLVT